MSEAKMGGKVETIIYDGVEMSIQEYRERISREFDAEFADNAIKGIQIMMGLNGQSELTFNEKATIFAARMTSEGEA